MEFFGGKPQGDFVCIIEPHTGLITLPKTFNDRFSDIIPSTVFVEDRFGNLYPGNLGIRPSGKYVKAVEKFLKAVQKGCGEIFKYVKQITHILRRNVNRINMGVFTRVVPVTSS